VYYPHFGLKEPPFKITPNTDFFFSGGNRGAVLDALMYAITNGEGIIKVVGEVGSGKTMLCRMLQTILPEKIESIYLANPSVAPEDVLDAIAFELQLKIPKNADRLKVMQILQAHLLKRHAEGRQVVIFVEEAQGMPLATLEEIRLLSNLETKQDKLLQIVLFGQPELDVNLNETHIRQLRERITHSFHLGPLQTKDISDYLIFRLRAAGYHGPHLFTDAAVKKLSGAAEGLVRRVNILADKALLSAFAENAFQVTHKHVKAAIQDSEFGEKSISIKHYLWFAMLLICLLSTALIYQWWKPTQALKTTNAMVAKQVNNIAVKGLPAKSPVAAVLAESKVVAKVQVPNDSIPSALVVADKPKNVMLGTQPLVAVPVSQSHVAVAVKDVTQPALPAPQKAAPQKLLSATAPVLAPAKLTADAVMQKNEHNSAEKTPMSVESVADKPIEAKASLVESRLEATKNWLFSGASDTVTMQIKSLRFGEQFNDELLKAELEMTKRQLGVDNLYVYRKIQNGENYAVILYGSFTKRSEAVAALKKLPNKIQNNRPYLRTLAVLNKEIEQ
jgi:type II secretory pathway predicted ATPase ExeA/septal ring-binding cell division protein DamX